MTVTGFILDGRYYILLNWEHILPHSELDCTEMNDLPEVVSVAENTYFYPTKTHSCFLENPWY